MSQLVAGVDGCKNGWLVVVVQWYHGAELGRAQVVATFQQVINITSSCHAVAVDMPIGLPDRIARGGRAADREARRLLHASRRSSVFPVPPRAVLDAGSFQDAVKVAQKSSDSGSGISRQTYAILPKIREVDAVLTPELQERVVEVHPELSFRAINDETPLNFSKKSARGMLSRLALLRVAGLTEVFEQSCVFVGGNAAYDDVLDACAVAWTARRVAQKMAFRIPDPPEIDSRGLRMEMWR